NRKQTTLPPTNKTRHPPEHKTSQSPKTKTRPVNKTTQPPPSAANPTARPPSKRIHPATRVIWPTKTRPEESPPSLREFVWHRHSCLCPLLEFGFLLCLCSSVFRFCLSNYAPLRCDHARSRRSLASS